GLRAIEVSIHVAVDVLPGEREGRDAPDAPDRKCSAGEAKTERVDRRVERRGDGLVGVVRAVVVDVGNARHPEGKALAGTGHVVTGGVDLDACEHPWRGAR